MKICKHNVLIHSRGIENTQNMNLHIYKTNSFLKIEYNYS